MKAEAGQAGARARVVRYMCGTCEGRRAGWATRGAGRRTVQGCARAMVAVCGEGATAAAA